MDTCWIKVANKNTRTLGVEGAMHKIKKYLALDNKFGSVCHEYSHEVGHFARSYYSDFTNGTAFSLPEESNSCAFGFYHGLMASVESDDVDMVDIKDFCYFISEMSSSEKDDVLINCFHGVGHGLSVRVTDWKTAKHEILKIVGECTKLEADDNCVQAAFGDLRWQYLNEFYFKKYPDAVGKSIEEMPHFFDFCETITGYERVCIQSFVYGIDTEKPLGVLLKVSDGQKNVNYQQTMIHAISKTYSRSVDDDSRYAATNDCLKLDSENNVNSCITGIVEGLYETFLAPHKDVERSICRPDKLGFENASKCKTAINSL